MSDEGLHFSFDPEENDFEVTISDGDAWLACRFSLEEAHGICAFLQSYLNPTARQDVN